jgi:hypothetical protein
MKILDFLKVSISRPVNPFQVDYFGILFDKSLLSDAKIGKIGGIKNKEIYWNKKDEKSVENHTDVKKYVKIY